MEKKRSGFRRPDAGEQEILDGLEIRLITLEETGRFNELVAKHHYLKSSMLVGEHMRYVATFEGEWLALGAWSAGALHLKGRDGWIGWNDEQRHRRLPLVVNNARLLGLPGCQVPNLMEQLGKEVTEFGRDQALACRLDNVLDEDRSRVRNPNAALVLGMFRRVVVSFAIPWSLEKKKTNKRTATRNFLEHLNAENHRRAFDLVTSKAPTAWKN